MKAKSEYPGRHGDQHLPDGSDPITGLRLSRLLWGSLADDGSIVEAGSGDWTTPGTGDPYVISFDDFPTNPSAVATITSLDSSPGSTIEITGRTTGSVTFQTYDADGSTQTASFDFLIIGAV